LGLILDSSVLIANERRGQTVRQMIERVRFSVGDVESAVSVISIVELTHGIYRAKTDADIARRKAYTDEICLDLVVHPVSLAIAQLAGRIEGEQASRGISIAFEDLLIGATAIHLGFDVATLNVKHFRTIPGLTTILI
jgi:predicted nucleic acid-binding protein